MSDIVSRETGCFTTPAIQAQIEARREGRRKHVHHGGTLCSGCYQEPPLPGQRYGKNCHRLAVERWRARKKAENAKNAAIAVGMAALLEQHTMLSKGNDHDQRTAGDPSSSASHEG